MLKMRKFAKRLSAAVGLVAVSALAIGVLGAGAASASTPYWYGCHHSSPGFGYSDSSCTGSEVAGGSYRWLKLPASPQIAMTMKGTTPFILRWETGGSKLQTTCGSMTSSGYKVWNETPKGERSAEFSAGSIQLSGCITKKPSGEECKTTISSIETTSEYVFEAEGRRVMRLKKQGFPSFFQVNAEPCGLVQKPFGSGLMDPTISSTASSLEFTAANTKGLSVGGSPATLEGSSKLEGSTEPWVSGAIRLFQF